MSTEASAGGPRRIAANQVKYLAFEGGGGAGNAYPGALVALHGLDILKYQNYRQTGVWGIAGSSAGAITALFLSLGYTPVEMEGILAGQDFNEFFDPIRAGFVPRIGGCITAYTHKSADEVLQRATDSFVGQALLASKPGLRLMLREVGKTLRDVSGVARANFHFAGFLASLLLGTLGKDSEGVISDRIMEGIGDGQLLSSLMFDYGLFCGQAIRNFFATGIAKAVRRVEGLPSTATTIRIGSSDVRLSEINFEQHQAIFGCKLVVTGSNLETGMTELFSADTTPKFIVADAVRISMSIPIAYKPLVLKDPAHLAAVGGKKGSFLEGVWVDGGLFNNTPVGVFDQGAGTQERTVAFRLRVDGHVPINNFVDFYSAYPVGMARGTGESQLSGTLSPLLDRTIELPVTTDEMGLFTFSPSASVYRAVNERSRQVVLDYFG
jgi:predicted acylesterase/phospholipase RssA